LILSNWIGLIVLITGTAVGMFCILSNVRRIQMMGCLLLPSIIYYLM
jgi:TctA family transporter